MAQLEDNETKATKEVAERALKRAKVLHEALERIALYDYQDFIGEAGDFTVADQMRADARQALSA